MSPNPIIVLETKRLLMRRPVMDDLNDYYALYQDPDVRRYIPDYPRTYEDTRAEVDWFLNGHPKNPKLGLWATIYKPTGDLIGRCGLLPWTIEDHDEVEVAYLLAKAYWGQGLGTEAAQAVAAHGFNTLHLPRLISLIDPENAASQRVAEKVGMTYKRSFEDAFGLSQIFAMTNPMADGPTG